MKILLKRTASVVTLCAMLLASSAFLKADAAANSVTYVKYVCATNTRSEYTLTQNDAATAMQTYGLVGVDDRKRDGYTGIVRLSNNCTGFIVDNHTIATSAHCVSKINAGTQKQDYESTHYFIPNMKVYLYNEDGTPRSTTPLTIVEMHIPKSYESGFSRADDYALVTVAEDLSVLECAQFDLGLAYNVNSGAFMLNDVYVSGIPADLPGSSGSNTGKFVYTGKGTEAPDGLSNSAVFCYSCDTTGGQSGSPVYMASQYTVGNNEYITYTAIAIHSGGGESVPNSETYYYNEGSPITSSKLQFYLNNENIGY